MIIHSTKDDVYKSIMSLADFLEDSKIDLINVRSIHAECMGFDDYYQMITAIESKVVAQQASIYKKRFLGCVKGYSDYRVSEFVGQLIVGTSQSVGTKWMQKIDFKIEAIDSIHEVLSPLDVKFKELGLLGGNEEFVFEDILATTGESMLDLSNHVVYMQSVRERYRVCIRDVDFNDGKKIFLPFGTMYTSSDFPMKIDPLLEESFKVNVKWSGGWDRCLKITFIKDSIREVKVDEVSTDFVVAYDGYDLKDLHPIKIDEIEKYLNGEHDLSAIKKPNTPSCNLNYPMVGDKDRFGCSVFRLLNLPLEEWSGRDISPRIKT